MGRPTGVLLVNLGTPDAPDTSSVRRYLRQFLSDPRVIDINPVGRWALLNLIILPLRPKRSAHAYAQIWSDGGSPLLVHGKALARGVAERLDASRYCVKLAMRYGNPSLPAALDELRQAGCDHIVVCPLYPQFAASTTGSTVEEVYRLARGFWDPPLISVVPPFFDDPRFAAAWASVAKPALDELAPDHVLMSFHGLPVRHLHKSDPTGQTCLASDSCCAQVRTENRRCYRAQCFATAESLRAELALPHDKVTVSFQSRLGRQEWIRPYTDDILTELATKGVRKLAVMCPAFVADCLETLEEIGLRADEDFQAAGGESLTLVPSLNADPAWVDTVVALVRETAGERVALPTKPPVEVAPAAS